MCIYRHKQNLSSKIQAYSTKIAWYAAFKPPYLPMRETISCQRPKFLAATSNLRVEQNLVHLGRFWHFSQKVVGVTLIKGASNIGWFVSRLFGSSIFLLKFHCRTTFKSYLLSNIFMKCCYIYPICIAELKI